MKLVLISDIHGNAVALEAVLNDIKNEEYDQVVCLGDVASLGPQPTEVMDMLIKLNPACVSGNHDEALLQPERWDELNIHPIVQPDLRWCLAQLQEQHIGFIRTFCATVEIEEPGCLSVLCCHGSPRSSTGILHPDMPEDIVSDCLLSCPADIIANGHLHCQFHETFNGKHLVNPGSVGMPFKVPPGPDCPPVMHPWAEYAVLSLNDVMIRGIEALRVELRRVHYDFGRLEQVLNATSLPGKSWWLEQLAQPGFLKA